MLRFSPARRESKCVKQQLSPAAALPPDIVLPILRFLDDRLVDISGPDAYKAWTRRSELECALYAVVLVCKAWLPAATSVLYENIRLTSYTTLKLFLRTLRRTPTLRPLVRSFAVLPLAPRKYGHKHNSRSIWKPTKLLVGLSTLCPNLIDLRLQHELYDSPRILVEMIGSENITKLHLTSRGLSRPLMSSRSLTFPALLDLHLAVYNIDGWLDWPGLPLLRSLRLSWCSIVGHDPKQYKIPNLCRLELLGCLFKDDDVFYTSLRLLSPTLEFLSILDTFIPTYPFQGPQDLAFMTTLRCFCVGEKSSFTLGTLYDELPHSLRQLILLESDPAVRSAHSEPQMSILDALVKLLDSEREVCYPNLEKIYVMGQEGRWSGWNDYFTKRCQAIGITFRLDFNDVPSTERMEKRRGRLSSLFAARKFLT